MFHHRLIKFLIILLLSGIGAAEAVAHPLGGWHPDHSFTNGLLHPLQGIDHLIAMIGIGLWVGQSSCRYTRWLIAVGTFSLLMASAFLISYKYSLDLGYMAESGIGMGLMILGVILVFIPHFSFTFLLPLIAVMAAFHGIAHAEEINQNLSPLWFMVGFISATLLLQYMGFAWARLGRPQLYLQFFSRALIGIGALLLGSMKVLMG